MNYFDYAPKSQMGKIWSLFERLGSLTDEEILGSGRHDYSHTMDIIKSAMAGNIDLSDENIRQFNLQGYEFACRQNEKIVARQNVEKELFIVDSTGESDSEQIKFGDIPERKLKACDSLFDDMLTNSDFEQNILRLCNIRNEYIIEDGIDIVALVHGALLGIKEAVDTLLPMLSRSSSLLELVQGICEVEDHDFVIGRLAGCLS